MRQQHHQTERDILVSRYGDFRSQDCFTKISQDFLWVSAPAPARAPARMRPPDGHRVWQPLHSPSWWSSLQCSLRYDCSTTELQITYLLDRFVISYRFSKIPSSWRGHYVLQLQEKHRHSTTDINSLAIRVKSVIRWGDRVGVVNGLSTIYGTRSTPLNLEPSDLMKTLKFSGQAR